MRNASVSVLKDVDAMEAIRQTCSADTFRREV